jgi:hypothetical protein
MKMKSAGNFWVIFLIIFDDEYFVEFSIDFKYSRTKAH